MNSLQKQDPTQTYLIRRAFIKEITRRMNAFKAVILKAIVDEDCFGLEKKPVTVQVMEAALPGSFAFKTSTNKVPLFGVWMAEQFDKGVLGLSQSVNADPANIWPHLYLTSSFKQGLKKGYAQLKAKGYADALPDDYQPEDRGINAAFNTPQNAARANLVFTRAYTELKGISAAMDKTISHTLAQGIVDGLNPKQMGKQIAAQIDTITRTRAVTIARTETIRAHHVANIGVYRQAGIEGVTVEAEWSTAGDERVCPVCEKMAATDDGEERVYSLDEIEPLIPAHPNCRCSVIPLPAVKASTNNVAKHMKGLGWVEMNPDQVKEANALFNPSDADLSVSPPEGAPEKVQEIYTKWYKAVSQKGWKVPFGTYYQQQFQKAQTMVGKALAKPKLPALQKLTKPPLVKPPSPPTPTPIPKAPTATPASVGTAKPPERWAEGLAPPATQPGPPPDSPINKPSGSKGLFGADDFAVGMKDTGVSTGGSTGATMWIRPDGSKWNVKFYKGDTEQVSNEWFANQMYEMMGVPVPETRLIRSNGKLGVATRWLNGVNKVGSSPQLEKQWIGSTAAMSGAPVDMWLANWDWAGTGLDNIVTDLKQLWRVDQGGSLLFRAQGGLKGQSFGATVGEITSMRDAAINSYSAKMYSDNLTDQELAKLIKGMRAKYDAMRAWDLALESGYTKKQANEIWTLLNTRLKYMEDWAKGVEATPGVAVKGIKSLPKPVLTQVDGVTAEEWKGIVTSRSNGFAIPLDTDQIEDQQVLFWVEKDSKGKEVLRASWKFRDTDEVKKLLTPSKVSEGTPLVSEETLELMDEEYRIGQGLLFRMRSQINKGVADWDDVLKTRYADWLELTKKAEKAYMDSVFAVDDYWKQMTAYEKEVWEGVKGFRTTANVWQDRIKMTFANKEYDPDWGLMDDQILSRKPLFKHPEGGGLAFAWEKSAWEYEASKMDRGFIQRLGRPITTRHEIGYTARGVKYEKGGVRITVESFDPGETEGSYAGRGWAMASIDDSSGDGVKKLMGALKESGFKTARPEYADAEDMFLQQWAYRAAPSGGNPARHTVDDWDKYAANLSKMSRDDRIAFLKKELTFWLGKAPDDFKTYRDAVMGVTNGSGFGNGRRIFIRPDLVEDSRWESFMKDRMVRKTWTDSTRSMPDGVALILDSGGGESAQMERVRKGLEVAGESLREDRESGGAARNFFYTGRRGEENDVGFYYDPHAVARMDAIYYPGDRFGRAKNANYVRDNNLLDTFEHMKSHWGGGQFSVKDNISLLEGLYRINVSGEKSRKALIQVFRDRGYLEVNGIKVEDLVVVG